MWELPPFGGDVSERGVPLFFFFSFFSSFDLSSRLLVFLVLPGLTV